MAKGPARLSMNDDAHKENRSRHGSCSDMTQSSKASAGSVLEPGAAPPQYDATDDIQDIDRRLNALQQFLEAAKVPR